MSRRAPRRARSKESKEVGDQSPPAAVDRPIAAPLDRTARVLAVVVAASALAFIGALGHRFVWDDHIHLIDNPHLNPPSWAGLGALWAAPHANLYSPMVYSAWAGLSVLARGDGAISPFPFHAAVIVLHALNSLACYLLLRRLVRDSWAAAAGALLFALHPLHVEAVAWASGLKDVLCGTFSLAALLVLVGKGEPAPTRGSRLLATAFYGLALLTKPAAVALPVLAIALELLALRRSRARAFSTFAIWTLLAVPIVLLTRQAQPLPPSVSEVPLLGRAVVALDAVAFYLGKLAFPWQLTSDYGRKPASVLSDPATVATVALAVAALLAGWWIARRRPLVSAAGLLWLGPLLPVLGLLPFVFQYVSTVADRYCYLALLGPALLAAVGLRGRNRLVYLGAGAALALLAARSVVQVRVWADDVALHGHALRHRPHSLTAHMGLAEALDRAGKFPQATVYARGAVAIEPYGSSWFLLGTLLGKQGQLDEAEKYLQLGLQARPDDGRVHYNLGLLYKLRGDHPRAIDHFGAAHELAPALRENAAWQLNTLSAGLQARDGS